MTTLKSIYITFFFICFYLAGFTQTTKTVDSLKSIEQKCLDSGSHMPSCASWYLIQIDSLLNVVYNKLQLTLDSSQRIALKKEQLQWLQKRNKYYKHSDKIFEDSLRSGSWGPEMQVIPLDEKAYFTEQRVLILVKRIFK